METFHVPKDGAIYAASIIERCHDLIAYGLWSGIEPHRLDAWVGNFRTEEERYFAARVLDNLIYRSDKQTAALMRQLYTRTIPDMRRLHNLDSALGEIYASLQGNVDPGIRLVPVIPPHAPPTKSGTIIARMLRRLVGFNDDWIVNPNEVIDNITNVTTFIFIDDFLGTGQQFTEFIEDSALEGALGLGCFLYTPLVAHEEGIDNVRDEHPSLFVDTVELLNDHHALFHEEAGCFPDEQNSCDTAREFYYNLLANRGIDIEGPNRRGFGHFELAYAFQHAAPDNSLPILWWDKSADWKPLFDR